MQQQVAGGGARGSAARRDPWAQRGDHRRDRRPAGDSRPGGVPEQRDDRHGLPAPWPVPAHHGDRARRHGRRLPGDGPGARPRGGGQGLPPRHRPQRRPQAVPR